MISIFLKQIAFHCITTLQCDSAPEIFQAGIESRWLYISRTSYPRVIVILSVSEGILCVYLTTLSATRSAQFLRRAMSFSVWGNRQIFRTRVLNPQGAYIYIYIYWHLRTDCFVVSQLFSVTRPTRFFKLVSKLCRLNVTGHLTHSQRKGRNFIRISFYIYVIGYLEYSIAPYLKGMQI